MPSNEPTGTKKEQTPAEQQAEDLDTWLRGNDEDPERYKQLADGSVQVKILHPYQKDDKHDPDGQKIVTLRTMYAKDWRELSEASDNTVVSTHATVMRLGDIEEHDLLRITWVDYSALLVAAQGVLEKKFRPTS